jgi:protein-L-isoaspartate(D-aspartate) O-methyltransferase
LFFEILTFNFTKKNKILKDTAKHQGLRNQLVSVLQQRNNRYKSFRSNKKNSKTSFLNSSFEDYAYLDKAFPIGAGQTISQPYTVAFQSQLLEIKRA